MRTSPITVCCAALALALFTACEPSSGQFRATGVAPTAMAPDESAEPATEPATGTLQAGLSLSGEDDVAGFRFVVSDASGIVAQAEKALEEENLPADLAPQGGALHRFADAYFLLPEGDYEILAIPIDEYGDPSADCLPVEGLASVVAGQTTEIVLVSQCVGEQDGGLDVIAMLNHAPRLTQLYYEPSKWILTCESVSVTALASDPDGDPIAWTWEVTGEPTGALYEAEALDGTFQFVSKTAGTYEVKVTVCEAQGDEPRCAHVTFPIHVTMSVDEDGDGIGDECDECTWDQEIGCCESIRGTTVGAPSQFDAYYGTGLPQTGPELSWVFIPESDCHAVVTLTEMSCDLDLFVLTEACDPESSFTHSAQADTNYELAEFDAVAGTPYHLVVDGYQGAEGSFVLSVVCYAPGDDTASCPVEAPPL